ncbi:MAG TPA: hypothetical protein VM261_33750 [Kofleriaceae bacterium]|nr:hypothetical protein [Kofleriaceae bacterium]
MSSHVARALAIAAYRPGDAAAGDAALARIAGLDGVAARAMLAAMHVDEALVARVRRELAAPRPANWLGVHRTWLDELLTGEGPAVRAAVLGAGDGRVERHLARAFLGSLTPMPDPAAPARGVHALVVLDPEVLARAIMLLGRRQLAYALVGAARRELADLAMRLPWGKELVAEVAAIASLGDVAEKRLGRRTSAAARIHDLRMNETTGPARAGLRALAPRVVRVPDLALQLAQRLARPVGMLARVELRGAHPPDGVDDVELGQAIARASVVSEKSS